MRIAFLIHDLGPGGAERVMVHLANGLSGRGHEVTIHTLSAKAHDSFYPLDDKVQHVRLGLNTLPARKGIFGTLAHVLHLVAGLRRHLQSEVPDVLVAFIDMTNIFALLGASGLRLPVIVSERSDPGAAPLRWPWRILRQLSYPMAAALVVQSSAARNWFPPWIRRKAVVIPNPVFPPPSSSGAQPDAGGSHRLIAVGRLSHEKGFDLLIKTFAWLAPQFPDWDLEIWGEGPERLALEGLRDESGLSARVQLPGLTEEIHTQYARSDLFVLSSRFEGFPNALCEAMSHGLPVVATSCSGGVRDIIRQGVDGLLVPPEEPMALAEAMARLMGYPSLREVLGTNAREVVQRFSVEDILDQWENCLLQAVR